VSILLQKWDNASQMEKGKNKDSLSLSVDQRNTMNGWFQQQQKKKILSSPRYRTHTRVNKYFQIVWDLCTRDDWKKREM